MPQNNQIFISEIQLYNALKSRQSHAYNYLYSKVLNPFKQWVYKNNGSGMDAEDAFQKGLLNFLINLENGKYQIYENTKITTVVFDYCKKIWLNELASSRVKTQTKMPDLYNPADDTDLQRDIERIETINSVKNALNLLKEDCRRLIEWFYIDEFSLKEIAEKLNMKETSTKQKRFDCMQKLRGIFTGKLNEC